MIALEPLGDRGFLARFASEPEARGWASAVKQAGLEGLRDIVLAYRNVGIFADPDHREWEILARDLAALPVSQSRDEPGRLIRLPVHYDGEDLLEIATRVEKSIDEVIALHSGREYRVQAVGFLPGFPYAGDLAPELSSLARREAPRPRVPSGSVAIAGRQTGIYPAESPGGWHLLGRTPLAIVDVDRGIFPIRAGDRLRFDPIDSDEYRDRIGEWLAEPPSEEPG